MQVSIKALLCVLLVAFGLGIFFPSYFSQTGLATSINPSFSSSFSGIQTAFCPSSECTTLPVSVIDSALKRVDVAMYSFTNQDFSDALIRAHERGVVVRVIVEKQQAGSQYSQHDKLASAGILVRIDSNPNYMHDKFAVVDDSIIINGSMNWTGNGVNENNENVMVIYSPELNTKFAEEFEKIWNDSDAYAGS